MLHTYLICSMEPELYEYENDNADSYDEEVNYPDEAYQEGDYYGYKEEDEDEDDPRDELYHDYMNEYEDDYYTPEREI